MKLQATPIDELTAVVEAVREELTVSFYEFAAERVSELDAVGDYRASASLDELVGGGSRDFRHNVISLLCTLQRETRPSRHRLMCSR